MIGNPRKTARRAMRNWAVTAAGAAWPPAHSRSPRPAARSPPRPNMPPRPGMPPLGACPSNQPTARRNWYR